MAWYVNDIEKLSDDWNYKLRLAGFFRTRYTYNALNYLLKQIAEKPEQFKVANNLEKSMPQDVYLKLAQVGLLANTRKTNLLKKLLQDALKH